MTFLICLKLNQDIFQLILSICVSRKFQHLFKLPSGIFQKIRICVSALMWMKNCPKSSKQMRNVLIKFSKTFFPTHLSSLKRVKLNFGFMKPIEIGNKGIQVSTQQDVSWRSRSRTQALGSHGTNKTSSLKL